MSRIIAVIVAAVGLIGLAGCNHSPPSMPDPSPAANAAVEAARCAAPRETWDIYVMQGKRIGYGHTTVRHEVEAGQPVVATGNVGRLAIKRADQTTALEIRAASVETPQGRLIRFESQMRMGPSPRRTVGQVRGNRLDIETTSTGAAPARESIAWSPDDGGPFASDQSLRRKPMRPGQRRKLKMLMIEFNQVADVEMAAKGYEPTALWNGNSDLLRVEIVTRLADGQTIKGTAWTDRTGEVLKTYSQAMSLETFRAGKAEAMKEAGATEFDLLPSTMVKVERPLTDPHQTKQVRYRVHLDGGDPASFFLTGPTQLVKSIDAHTAEITVYAIRPGQADGNRGAPADPPTDDDLRPNGFIQSDDPTILADARKAGGGESDPWRVAVALERYVHREVATKDFSQAFATAAEVAKMREGDCTEHAVFLAALCRARGIPARVAIGLVYMEGLKAFGYHMWTEVYIDKRWIPIDGTLALGGIGAGHLEIAHSNLKGASAYSAFLPVVQILGRLKIDPM